MWLHTFGNPVFAPFSWHETVCRTHPRTMIAEPAHFYLFGLICLCSGNPRVFFLHPGFPLLIPFPLFGITSQTPSLSHRQVHLGIPLLRLEGVVPLRDFQAIKFLFHIWGCLHVPPSAPHLSNLFAALGFSPKSGTPRLLGERTRVGGGSGGELGPQGEPRRASSTGWFLGEGGVRPRSWSPTDSLGFLNLALQIVPPLPSTGGC